MKPFRLLALPLCLLVAPRPASAADAPGPDPREVREVADKAIAFLRSRQQEDGGFSTKFAGPGITALVVAGMLRHGVNPDDPTIQKAMAALEKSVKQDGGIYDKGLANYTTSVALLAFREANVGGKYDSVISGASKFLKGLQHDASKQVNDKDVRFGGAGYDGKSRPDLSNTQYFLDALQAAGVGKDDPAVQNALKFISRCQNLPGETNDQAFATKTTPTDKGGLVYSPLDRDDSPHRTAGGGLRSVGAMTYAGLKSFLYAGVTKDDPRVKAALDWVRRNYTLEDNPGQGQNGLYYYYHTFAKAQSALGETEFVDAAGKKHDWRRELFQALKSRQRADGSWINTQRDAYGEGNADLATAFGLLALSYCKAPTK